MFCLNKKAKIFLGLASTTAITMLPFALSSCSCFTRKTTKDHVSILSGQDIKITKDITDKEPRAHLKFKILKEWETGYKLNAVIANQQQVAGYGTTATIKEDVGEISVVDRIADVPIEFTKGLLYGDPEDPDSDTKVEFDLTLYCVNEANDPVWDTTNDSFANKKFSISYEFCPWTADRIDAGPEEQTYTSAKKVCSFKLNTKISKKDLPFFLTSPNQVVAYRINGSKIEDLKNYIGLHDPKWADEYTYTIQAAWHNQEWHGDKDFRFYFGIATDSINPLDSTIYLHWDEVHIHFTEAK